MIGQRPLILWITISLGLHVAGLALCPAPGSFSPLSPMYLVVDLFSGPATSGTGHGLDDESAGGKKIKDLPHAHPADSKPQPKNLQSPQPTTPIRPTKVAKENPASHEPDTIKSPPEKPPTLEENMTTDAPVLAATAEPLTGHPHNLENIPLISASSGTDSEHATNGGTGTETEAGHGSGAGLGRGGSAGSGSPVETPFAYGSNPPPPYPSTARRRGWEGEVLLLVNVNARGEVCNVTVNRSSGYQILDRAALTAVYRWQFQAAQRNGRAVAGKVMVPIRFSIKDAK